MALLDTVFQLDQRVVRNIISLRTTEDLFDDLSDDPADQLAAIAVEMSVRTAPTGMIERGLCYSQAIDYPFSSDETVASRFGDGTNRVWYGALDEATARAETCWHALREIESLATADPLVTRYRAVYVVRAQGLFLDIRAKAAEHPEIVGDDYSATQGTGKYASKQGYPGLLYPSARWSRGECLAVFRADPLSEAVLSHYLTYIIDVKARMVSIQRTPGKLEEQLHYRQLSHAGTS